MKTRILIKRFKLDSRIVRTIAFVKKRGEQLAEDFPEIADMYREGDTLMDIARRVNTDIHISERVAETSVYEALKELIDEEELRELGRSHSLTDIEEHGRIGGETSFNRGHGCFDMTKIENQDGRRKGGENSGAITGKKNYQDGIGIASMTKKDLYQAGRNAALARGEIPFEIEPRETEYGRMSELGYVSYLKRVKRESWKEIAGKTISIFGNERSPECFKSGYERRRARMRR